MAGSGESLPEALEDQLYNLHFDTSCSDRTARFEQLCAEHPEHADVLRQRRRRLLRSDELLVAVHDELVDDPHGTVIGPFRIERVLGEGGFGTVYLASQQRPVQRTVALKILQAGRGDTRARQRFEDERHLLARLQHACIAQIYDAGTSADQRSYIAMEYVDGAPITAWCRERKVDVDARLRLFLRVCAAIQYAHQREIVHRDLKPSNILVREEDGVPLPKVIDFGIARLIASRDRSTATDMTRVGDMIGTPGYMSPEQAAGESVDTRTDVYSLGALLCELLTDELPHPRTLFADGNYATYLRALMEEPPRRPSVLLPAGDAPKLRALRKRLRDDLDWIVLKAAAGDRERRYASVAALADDVERHLQGEPIRASQRTSTYLLRKFVARHRVAVGVAALVVLSLLAAVASLAWGLDRVNDARSMAEADRDIARARARASRMAVAQLSLAAGDIPSARDNLASIAPGDRDWAWRHLVGLCDTSTLTIPIEEQTIEVVWIDERRVAAFPRHHPASVFDAATGELAYQVELEGVTRRVKLDRASGRAIVASDAGLALWDLRANRPLQRLGRVPGEPFDVEWASDGASIVAVGSGRWLEVRDVVDGSVLESLRLEHNSRSLATHGDALLIGYEDGSIEYRRSLHAPPDWRANGHTDHVDDLLVDARRDLLFSASIDGFVRVWNLSDGTPITAMPCNMRMQRLELSSDGRRLYGCGGYVGCCLASWETETFQLLAYHHGHVRGVTDIAIAPDGERIASVSRDNTLRLWSSEPPTPAVRLEAGRDARTLSRSPDGSAFGAASLDGQIKLWDAHTLEPILHVETEAGWTGSVLARDVFYVAGRDVRGYDRKTGAVVAQGVTNGARIESMQLDPEQRWLVGGYFENLLVWRLPELELLHELPIDVCSRAIVWDASRGQFAFGCTDATVSWLAPEQGTIEHRLSFDASAGRIGGVAMHGDLLAASNTEGLHVQRAGRDRLQLTAPMTCAAFWPNGQRMVSGGPDLSVRIWDLSTGDQLLLLNEPEYCVAGVHLVDDGNRLIALSHRWDAPSYVYVWSAPAQAELGR